MSYADFDDDFQEADENTTTTDNGDAPDGTYQCEIKRFFENTTKDGTGRLNCVLQIVSGEYSGKTLYKSWIFTQSAMSYIKQDFKRFGLPVESKKFSELVPMLDTAVVGKWCEAAKKQNGQYANVYINSMLEPLVETKKATKTPKAAKTSKTSNVRMFEGAKAVATESLKETAQAPCIYEEAKTITPESGEDIPF